MLVPAVVWVACCELEVLKDDATVYIETHAEFVDGGPPITVLRDCTAVVQVEGVGHRA